MMRRFPDDVPDIDPVAESLSQTPEGRGEFIAPEDPVMLEEIEADDWNFRHPESADPRDFTPNPPALLDVTSVLRNRQRVDLYRQTGAFTWPRAQA